MEHNHQDNPPGTVEHETIESPTSSASYQKPLLKNQGQWQNVTTQVGSFPFEP
ncbi:hypothetical protein [Deinococcus cellulosilyticus]|uniref:Uncharacterized protein n=1 Tax=Deinococcus cellulosilyticus (strain DSM 18568 / NBRC 106333 / KACC 11606 / 5516J-15) TaxID=1223518 RepID=A0A511N9U2_DEIC1|nr:hypothetical protein [Deinococcus cellulosilyticus]GEM49595.1 hypothetical protein DC3_52300 [Deinococcus cellulosilyticus NBRC 106333 = KACC 11606]